MPGTSTGKLFFFSGPLAYFYKKYVILVLDSLVLQRVGAPLDTYLMIHNPSRIPFSRKIAQMSQLHNAKSTSRTVLHKADTCKCYYLGLGPYTDNRTMHSVASFSRFNLSLKSKLKMTDWTSTLCYCLGLCTSSIPSNNKQRHFAYAESYTCSSLDFALSV